MRKMIWSLEKEKGKEERRRYVFLRSRVIREDSLHRKTLVSPDLPLWPKGNNTVYNHPIRYYRDTKNERPGKSKKGTCRERQVVTTL